MQSPLLRDHNCCLAPNIKITFWRYYLQQLCDSLQLFVLQADGAWSAVLIQDSLNMKILNQCENEINEVEVQVRQIQIMSEICIPNSKVKNRHKKNEYFMSHRRQKAKSSMESDSFDRPEGMTWLLWDRQRQSIDDTSKLGCNGILYKYFRNN